MDLTIEQEMIAKYSKNIIAGVDEVGRGAIAGVVVAAAVIIDQNNLITGINDSKQIIKSKREQLYNQITDKYQWGIGIVEPAEIDNINILQATIKASILAIKALPLEPELVIVDGNMKFSDPRFISIVKGDTKSISIAAASIIAKVTRDRIMDELGLVFPMYKWGKNAGYGTKEHLMALNKYGPSEHHRRSVKIFRMQTSSL